MTIYIHQEVEGLKAGDELADGSFPAPARLDFYIAQGYVSTTASRGVDQEAPENQPRTTDVPAADDPRLPDNPSAKTDYPTPPIWDESLAFVNDATVTPESFDPDEHTVAEINAYLARDDIHDAEKRRVRQAEREGQNRSTVNGI